MAEETSNNNPHSDPQDSVSSAADKLTPSSMKPQNSMGDDKTLLGPMRSTPSVASKDVYISSPTIMGGDHSSMTHVSDVAVQDLSSERLLKDAPRIEVNGQSCPSLNKIPLLAKIGQGGMGAVYYGIHPRLRSEVAVKVLPFHLAEQDPGMVRRFFREAQIAAQVHSPHLVNVMDVNEESGLFFLVMEYVAGRTSGQILKDLLGKGKPGYAEVDALDTCIAACEGLHAAHSQNIIHRDLKPENIMVPYLSRERKSFDLKNAKLMDLGLARSEDSVSQSLTGAQAAMGTPGYMAPEQALDAKTADKRSDVFGMGATLYCLLTGNAPFRGDAVMKTLMDTIYETHVSVKVFRPDISTTCAEIIDRCLDKKQENRYQDAAQLLRALKNCRRQFISSSESGSDLVSVDGGASLTNISQEQHSLPQTLLTRQSVVSAKATMLGAPSEAAIAPAISMPMSPPPRKRARFYSVAGALLLIVAVSASAIYYLKNFKKTVSVPIVKISDAARVIYEKDHADKIGIATAFAKEGDLENARAFLELAQTISEKLNDQKLQTKENDVKLLIGQAELKNSFMARLQQIDAEIQNRDLKKAGMALLEAKSMDAAMDQNSHKLIQEKELLLTLLQSASARKDRVVAALKRADALSDDKIDDAEMKKLEALNHQMPSEAEAKKLQLTTPWMLPNKDDLAKLQTRFSAIIKQRKDNSRYNQLLQDAETTLDHKQKMDLLQQAVELLPHRSEAQSALMLAKNKLEVAERQAVEKEIAEKKQQKFAAFVAQADKLQADDPAQALEAIREALKIQQDTPTLALEKQLVKIIAEKDAQNKGRAFLASVKDILDNHGDIAQAEENYNNAQKILLNNPKFAPEFAVVRQLLGEAKARAKAKQEYADLSSKARAAAKSLNAAEARKHYDAALRLDGTGAGLEGVAKYLESERMREMERQSRKEKYDKLMKDASGFEQAGDSRAKANEQEQDYQKAAMALTNAMNLATENDLTAQSQHKIVSEKLERAKNLAADERRKKEKERQQQYMRSQFAAELVRADQANNDGRPGDAEKILEKAKQLLLTDAAAFQDELKTAANRVAAYRANATELAMAQERQALANARIAIANKIKSGALQASSTEADNIGKSNPAAKESLRDVIECLRVMQKMKTAIAEVNVRLPDIDKRFKSKFPPERSVLLAAGKALEMALDDAVSKLSTPDFQAAPSLAKSLSEAKCAELNQMLINIEALSKKAAIDDSPPNEAPSPPNKRKPESKPKVDSKPPEKFKPTGEGVPDD